MRYSMKGKNMIGYFEASEFKGMQVKIEEFMILNCSISKEKYNARIVITYVIKNKQLELVSLRKFLKSFEEETIESLCKKIKIELSKDLKVNVKVIGSSKIHPKCEVNM